MLESLPLLASIITAIVLEAAPFLLVGSLFGALFEIFVPDRAIKSVPRNPALQLGLGLFAGMIMPTCECGVVPIVRKMLGRGVPATIAITYMLAAPVINPVVLASTYVAFQNDPIMVLLRCLLVAVPALTLGYVMGQIPLHSLLKAPKVALPKMGESIENGHDHDCGCASCADVHDQPSKLMAVIVHTGVEFLDMFRYLLFGACVAGLFKIYAPADFVTGLSESPILSIVGMMAAAIITSVCSEADAFVAAGFAMLPRAAQLAFVAVGPMVDLKLIAMFTATFSRRVVLALIIVPTVVVFFLALVIGYGEVV